VHSPVDRTLARNLTRLCQEIGIFTIAKFIENEAARTMGVAYAQGFHLARPAPQMF
jgi:EAL domain-containing protein (putative c-di-GMP-specific phosphodiesterase class I)